MQSFDTTPGRRQFLQRIGAASLLFTRRGLFAETLVTAPAQTEGPYYPDRMPMDQDNDLIIINDSITPAVGQVSWISGPSPWPARRDDAQPVNGKAPTSLDGVSVSISGKPAAIFYVSPNQLNVQAPSDDIIGDVQVTIANANGTSSPVTTKLQTYLPGFFLFPNYYVAAVRPDGSYVGPAGLFSSVKTTPAKPGEIISLFGIGFGPTIPRVAAGEVYQGAAPLTTSVNLRIRTTNALVNFAGQSAAGMYQLNITVPNLPDGDHDVVAKVGGVRTQSLARVRVQR